jgi:hypothetical protein
MKAFAKSLFSLKSSEAHDQLLLSVSSVAEQGGLIMPQEFSIPVRFTPPALFLLLAVLIGAILGALLHLGIAPAPAAVPPPKPAIIQVAIMVFLAVVVWIFALVLYSYTETRVTIFGFTLDPSQIVPAGLIALLAAGGPSVVAKIKEALQ